MHPNQKGTAMTHLRTQHQQGFALITTLIMLIVFLAIITTYTFLTTIETKTSDASVDSATGFYAAESGYNLRAEDIRTVFQDFRRPEGTSPNGTAPCVDGNDGSGAFECVSYALNDRTIHTYVQEDPRNGVDGRATTVSSGVYAGLNAIEYGYDFFSDAYPPNEIRPEASIETRLNVQLIPLFQFAAFYNKDLEIHPGPSMTLNGRVHVNGDLYITASSGLNITGQVSAARRDMELWPEADNDGGTLSTFRKDKNDNRSAAKVFDGSNLRSLDKGKTYTTNTALNDWNSRIQVGLDTLIVPPVNDFAIDDEGTYWSKADLRVLLRVNRSQAPNIVSIEIHDNDGVITAGDRMTVATTTLNSCLAVDDRPPYIGYRDDDYAFFGVDGNNTEHQARVPAGYQTAGHEPRVIEWSNTFYDGREGTDMLFMEVDVVGLLDCVTENSSDFGFDIDDESGGGLVWYFSVEGPDSDKVNNYGIRIRNGDILAATGNKAPDIAGLTIVSDQALYVQGDYNAEASDVNNTTWKPASFLGDTINILSEKFDGDFSEGGNTSGGWDATVYWWDYTKNPENWVSETRTDNKPDKDHYMNSGRDGDRDADPTTVRAAVLGGTDKTGGEEGTGGKWKGTYNGGLENYPRFHEDWGGKTFTYAGSFVSLGTPQFKDGKWGGGYYSAPNRVWQYEEAYNNAANLPPLSPRATYLAQGGFTRAYPER
jgi:hypothetical protein